MSSSPAAASRWATETSLRAYWVSWPRCISGASSEAGQAAQLRHCRATRCCSGCRAIQSRRSLGSYCLCSRRCASCNRRRPTSTRVRWCARPPDHARRPHRVSARGHRARPRRVSWWPATPASQMSARLMSFVGANAFLIVPPHDAEYPAGTQLEAMLVAPPRQSRR